MTPSKIAIITDSTCDIPANLLDQYAIQVVPHYIIWGSQQYLDRVNLQPEEFYRRLQTDSIHPTSAQAGEQDFQDAYQKAIQLGADELVVLTVSSAMSGAYLMALNASSGAGVPVHVIDSKGPTMSLGWQVLAAARARAAGGDAAAMEAEAARVRKKLVLLVGMDTMEYLQRGGRIGGAARWLGAMLQIRPLVSINHVTGLVEPVSIARTHKHMVNSLYDRFFEKLGPSGVLHVAVLHGDAPAEAQALVERIQQEYAPAELLINITGPVLGINTGPHALALCGYRD